MNDIFANWDQKCKGAIADRLYSADRSFVGMLPIMTASNIHYEVAERTHAIGCGGIGVFHLLSRKLGLIDAIDERLHLLKIHLPYHESDHVLNIAYNALCGGTCIQDIELHRNDETFLDALGARRIPDPTTAGDPDVSGPTIPGIRCRDPARRLQRSRGLGTDASGASNPSRSWNAPSSTQMGA